jgi:hypothetical protein
MLTAYDSVRAVYGVIFLRPLKHWDRGFESHSRHGYRLSAFNLCSCCLVYAAALRRADPSSKESYRLPIRLRN